MVTMTRPFVPLPVPRARRVAVIGGSRVPFARSDGPYATASNQDLLTAALNGLVERYGLAGDRVG
ncbi:acetyl-CoA C-acyltransferase, partial [Streptomyces sp. SID10362]|nr:acetyl-CoA C-acyltransferase [Streptomyces sp. SID10362]